MNMDEDPWASESDREYDSDCESKAEEEEEFSDPKVSKLDEEEHGSDLPQQVSPQASSINFFAEPQQPPTNFLHLQKDPLVLDFGCISFGSIDWVQYQETRGLRKLAPPSQESPPHIPLHQESVLESPPLESMVETLNLSFDSSLQQQSDSDFSATVYVDRSMPNDDESSKKDEMQIWILKVLVQSMPCNPSRSLCFSGSPRSIDSSGFLGSLLSSSATTFPISYPSSLHFNPEGGSNPEVLLAMSSLRTVNPESIIVCNGFKEHQVRVYFRTGIGTISNVPEYFAFVCLTSPDPPWDLICSSEPPWELLRYGERKGVSRVPEFSVVLIFFPILEMDAEGRLGAWVPHGLDLLFGLNLISFVGFARIGTLSWFAALWNGNVTEFRPSSFAAKTTS